MARSQSTQRQRTAANPLSLGTFNETTLRYLTGRLGGANEVVAGGYGGGTLNHWFKLKLETSAWVITVKGGGWEKWFDLSAYDINKKPISGRGIFDADSVSTLSDGSLVNPYVGHIMSAQSDLYNQYNPNRLDKGDSRYYPLDVGEYLLCVSSTLNIPFDYAIGMVIEMADPFPVYLTEDYSRLMYEDEPTESDIICDTTPNYTGAEDHEHSLTEWKTAWARERQVYEKFPDIFAPLTTRP